MTTDYCDGAQTRDPRLWMTREQVQLVLFLNHARNQGLRYAVVDLSTMRAAPVSVAQSSPEGHTILTEA